MGAVIIIGGIIILGFVVFAIYAMMRISSECSRWEENYRAKKERKNDSNESTKKTKSK